MIGQLDILRCIMGSGVVVVLARLVLLIRILQQPGRRAEEHSEAKAAGPAESGLLAAGEAVVVEGLQFLGLAAPGGAAEEVAAEPHAADLEAVAPEAPAAVALTHQLYDLYYHSGKAIPILYPMA